MSLVITSSLNSDNLELKELFQSFLDSHTDSLKFKKFAKRSNENPWNYQNYLHLVKNCLETIEKIFEALKITGLNNFAEITLNQAHIIRNNPKDSIEDNSFQYRNMTVNTAKTLCKAFETLCMNLQVNARKLKIRGFKRDSLITDLNNFKIIWNNFESNLLSDQDNAKNYFRNKSNL